MAIIISLYHQGGIERGDAIVKECINACLYLTGGVEATKSIKFKAVEVFKGEGYLKAPEITLDVGEFQFTGTIHCTGKCLISSNKAFDASIFKRVGGGTFEIRMPSQGCPPAAIHEARAPAEGKLPRTLHVSNANERFA